MTASLIAPDVLTSPIPLTASSRVIATAIAIWRIAGRNRALDIVATAAITTAAIYL